MSIAPFGVGVDARITRILGRRACGSKMGQTYPLHGESCLVEFGNARTSERDMLNW
jgi:hypothetical protein